MYIYIFINVNNDENTKAIWWILEGLISLRAFIDCIPGSNGDTVISDGNTNIFFSRRGLKETQILVIVIPLHYTPIRVGIFWYISLFMTFFPCNINISIHSAKALDWLLGMSPAQFCHREMITMSMLGLVIISGFY